MDRRKFLELGAAAVAGGSLNTPAALADLRPRLAPDRVVRGPASAWRQLSAGLRGTVVRPGDAGFLNLARPNNLRYKNILPREIALCEDASDVSFCLRWAEQNGIAIITRGGGHSYAGYSCTHGLMINLKNINGARFDSGSGT